MKKLILGILFIIGIVSCQEKIIYDGKTFSNYDMYVEYSINHLKSPVILVNVNKYKTNIDTYYSIMVKDANGIIKHYNHNADIVNTIGATYELGETIR